MFYVPSAKWNAKSNELILGDTHIYYRVVASMEDCMRIAGMQVHAVEWHYKPKEDVRNWVLHLVRCAL